jgi:hypothetical protein
MPKKIAFIMIVILIGYGFFVITKMYFADIYMTQSESYLAEAQFDKALIYAEKSVGLNPLEPNYYRNRARTYLGKMALASTDNDIVTYKLFALADMQQAYKLNPRNLVTMRNLVPLYFFLATKDVTKPAGINNVDTRFLGFAKEFYTEVSKVAPNDVGVYALLYKYEKRLGLQEELNYSTDKIMQLRPDLFNWYITD